jgi:uncharacterized protein (UPF0335 family)
MNADNLIYVLEALAGYEAKDVDDFDVLFETECGRDTGATCSVVDIAQQSADKLKEAMAILELARDAIGEAGYEDHSKGLMDRMDLFSYGTQD